MKTEVAEIVYGWGDMPETFVYENGAKDKFFRIVFRNFLIAADNKKIMVDAWCEGMPGWNTYDFIGPIKALEKFNLTPDAITDIIITHAHGDHIECVKYFKNSNIYIQRDEYENGKDNFTDDMNVILFDDEYAVCNGVNAVKIASHSVGSSVVEVITENDKIVLSGDEFYIWETIDNLKDKMNNPKFVPKDDCERKRVDFIKRYADWKIVLSHSKSEGLQ